MTGPCTCWIKSAEHSGHCCFKAGPPEAYGPDMPVPCGHDKAGMRMFADAHPEAYKGAEWMTGNPRLDEDGDAA